MPDRPRQAPPRGTPRPSRAVYGRPIAAPPEPAPANAATGPGVARIDGEAASETVTLIEFTWVRGKRIQPVIFVARRLLH